MKTAWALALTLLALAAGAQPRYYTKTGVISFFSKAPLENIEGVNRTVTAVLDAPTGALQFAVQMKGFAFAKALMQEHFNENYVESDRYPRAEFKGALVNRNAVVYGKDGTYEVMVRGRLSLHGVTRDVEAPGAIRVQGGKLQGTSTFQIRLSDYNIAVPALVKDKVSNTITISVQLALEPLNG